MNIKGINVTTYAVKHRETWVFVQIDTDEGIQGLGELNPSAPRGACLAALRQLEQLLIGEDPCQIAHLTEMVNMTAMDRPGSAESELAQTSLTSPHQRPPAKLGQNQNPSWWSAGVIVEVIAR